MSTDTKTAHTPTPWAPIPQTDGSTMVARVTETDNQMQPRSMRLVCHVMARRSSLAEDDANAAFIVRAVNAHDALTESLADLFRYCGDIELSSRLEGILNRADAALKLARGEA